MGRFRNQNTFDVEIEAAVKAYPLVPVAVVKATMATESAFDPGAYLSEYGDTASVGLMQLLPRTAQGLGYTGTVARLYIPSINISYGVKLLNQLRARLGSDWERVYSAYNGGVRPLLGFGSRVTKPTTVCLRRDPKTNRCAQTFTAQVGQFGNQPSVDRFARHLAYFDGRPEVAPVVPLLIALAGLSLTAKV